jgi:hypothetical protein
MNKDDIYQDIDWNIGKQIKDFLPSPAELMNAKTIITAEENLQSSHKSIINSVPKRPTDILKQSFFHSFTIPKGRKRKNIS